VWVDLNDLNTAFFYTLKKYNAFNREKKSGERDRRSAGFVVNVVLIKTFNLSIVQMEKVGVPTQETSRLNF